MVHVIENHADYDKVLEESKTNLVVIDCFATWCGPCKMIAPQVVKLSKEFTGEAEQPKVSFYKLDIDEVVDVAAELNVSAMPTFYFFKGGKQIHEVVGANPSALKKAIKEHAEDAAPKADVLEAKTDAKEEAKEEKKEEAKEEEKKEEKTE